MRNPFDQLAKQIGQEALGSSGATVAHDEINSETQYADLCHEQQEKVENLSFVLGARPWRAIAIDFGQGIVRVEPIASSNLARWQGRSALLGRDLCQAVRDVPRPRGAARR